MSDDTDIDVLVTEDEAFGAIAEGILSAVERNRAGEWEMPWGGFAARPTNAFSGKEFAGQNTLSLWAAAKKRGYTVHLWAPPKQWGGKGGGIRPGETGTEILVPVFDEESTEGVRHWDRNTKGIAKKLGPIGGDPEGGVIRPVIGFRKEFWFNAHQVDGLDLDPPPPPDPTEAALRVERTLAAWRAAGGPALVHGGMRACWMPSTDRIQMPPKQAYRRRGGAGAYEYYVQVLGHEHMHATGSKSRIGRDMTGSFGSVKYAQEELVAELGTSFLCARFGLPAVLLEHSAAYVKSWMGAMSDKKQRKAFFRAVREAEKAVSLILVQADA